MYCIVLYFIFFQLINLQPSINVIVHMCVCIFEFLHVHHCHVFLLSFLLCPKIQFETTRSSSPTECCHFSPWSRKVLVPPSLLLCAPTNTLYFTTPYLFLFVWLLLICIMAGFSNACFLNAAFLWQWRRPAPPTKEHRETCLSWNWRLRFPLWWLVADLRTQAVVVGVHVKAPSCSMWGMCVCEGCSHNSLGFTNDRVDFCRLASVITHDPSVLWFPQSSHPQKSWQPHASFSVCTTYIAHCEKEIRL